jgi:hypothetical protein
MRPLQIFNAAKYFSSFPALILSALEHEAHVQVGRRGPGCRGGLRGGGGGGGEGGATGGAVQVVGWVMVEEEGLVEGHS